MLIYLDQLSKADLSYLEMFKKLGNITFHPKKSVVFQQKDVGEHAYCTVNGIAKVVLLSETGQIRTVTYVTPGIFFGQAAVFLERPISSSIVVMSITDVEILSVSKEVILDCIHKNPNIASYLLKCSALQIESLFSHVEIDSFGDLIFQVASVLHSFPKQQKSEKKYVTLSQEELASIIGKSRITVAKSLHQLQDLQIIRLTGKKKIIIENEAELAYLAGDLQK